MSVLKPPTHSINRSNKMSKLHLLRTCQYCQSLFIPKHHSHYKHCSLSCRFWSKVEIGPHNKCWIWKAGCFTDGYGLFKIAGRLKRAHRVAFQLSHKISPGPAQVLHECDNTICCNPDHLFLGSTQDNTADRVKKNRSARGSKNGSAKLMEADIPKIRKLLFQGFTQETIAKQFKIGQAMISSIKRGECWGHV